MDIANIVEATVSVLGLLGGGLTFAFMSGKFVRSVEANTAVTEKLTEVIDNHLVWSSEWTTAANEKFHAHDKRISLLENHQVTVRIDNSHIETQVIKEPIP